MTRAHTRARDAMRTLIAHHGWREESLLVDHAAEVLGGDAEAQRIAQAVFDKHFKITEAN